jgi:hypothetical protein
MQKSRKGVNGLRTFLKMLFFRHCELSEAIQHTDYKWIASGYRPRNDVNEWFLEVLLKVIKRGKSISFPCVARFPVPERFVKLRPPAVAEEGFFVKNVRTRVYMESEQGFFEFTIYN